MEIGEGVAVIVDSSSDLSGDDEDSRESWYEIELVDECGEPLVTEYSLTWPNGETRSGTLDGKGRARVECGPGRGIAKVRFPSLEGTHRVHCQRGRGD